MVTNSAFSGHMPLPPGFFRLRPAVLDVTASMRESTLHLRDAWTRARRLLLLFAVLFFGLSRLATADALVLREGNGRYEPGRYLSYLEDNSGRLGIADVMGEKAGKPFKRAESDRLAFGFTDSAYWYRFQLRNADSSISDWILEVQYPLLDLIEVYLVYPGNRIVSLRSGDTMPFSQREIKHRNFSFPVSLARGEAATIFLRVKTESSMQMPLMLWSAKAFIAKDHEEQVGLGLYYGILLAMFGYNLMIFLSIRDINYLYYLHYIGGWIVFQMSLNGLAFEYLWPESPGWGNQATPFLLFFVGAGVIQFTRAFLQLKEHLPKFDVMFRAFFWIALALAASTFVLRYGIAIRLANGLGLVALALILLAGGLSLKLRVRQARYFMVAWIALLIGSIIFILRQFGILPSAFLIDYGMQIGSALEVILLSLALAQRIRMLKDENVRIQKEATELLEVRVQQRTQELDSALKDLSVASEKLRDLSLTDALTECKNRACFNAVLEEEWQSARNGRRAISLLMLDIDHFKQINDTYGHLGGDACLRQMAQAIRELIRRPGDEAFRYGGEEFAVLLPNTDLAGAIHLGKIILDKVASLQVVYEGKQIPVTVSIGAASMVPEAGMSSGALIGDADRALYEAKRRGRNKVCHF